MKNRKIIKSILMIIFKLHKNDTYIQEEIRKKTCKTFLICIGNETLIQN